MAETFPGKDQTQTKATNKKQALKIKFRKQLPKLSVPLVQDRLLSGFGVGAVRGLELQVGRQRRGSVQLSHTGTEDLEQL